MEQDSVGEKELHINDLVEDCNIPSALVMKIQQFCTKQWIYWHYIEKNISDTPIYTNHEYISEHH